MPGGATVVVDEVARVLTMHVEQMRVRPPEAVQPLVEPAIFEHQVPIGSVARPTAPVLLADGVAVPIEDVALDERMGGSGDGHTIPVTVGVLVVVNEVIVDIHGLG